VLVVLAAYRLIAPGSEWRLHRERIARTALADLLGADDALADPHVLYACHDRLLAHKEALFSHLVGRWRDWLDARFEVMLYDLTSTYLERDPPANDVDKRKHGYSRDHRPDCVRSCPSCARSAARACCSGETGANAHGFGSALI
jgi:hypothetical protein